MDIELPALFGRVGSKTRVKKTLYRFFPKDFNTYVEPFFGGGSVMFGYKFKPGVKIIINDKDKDLIRDYRILKSGVSITPEILKKYNNTTTAQKNALLKKNPSGKLGRIIHSLIKYNTTFGSTGKGLSQASKNINLSTKLKKLPEYKEKLKSVTILNESYESVINKYNRSGTFFYLDPPYEKSGDLYKHGGDFNFVKFAENLKKIKGKFMLSINDSKNIRDLFKGFKIKRITLGGQSNSESGLGSNTRKELIITNY